ncbi:MAG: hypothetical protein HGB11_13665 [Chlorobiales bacterium]|nr:hypothetical protein [Chlorobiales bacterium]
MPVDVMFPPAAIEQDESQFADEVTPTSMSGAVMEQVGTPMPNLIRAIPHIVVSGESGVGKTHFTRTANDGFCLDIEDGAGSEFDDDHKFSYNPGDPELAIKIMRDVVKMKSYKRDGQYLITPKGIRIRYLVVDTHNWWPGKKVLMVPSWISTVSWIDRTVEVSLGCEAIKAGPEYDPTQLNRAYEQRLRRHFRKPSYWDEAPVKR